MKQQNQNLLYVLDTFSHRDIKKWKKQHEAIAQYCWDHYQYLAYKRSLISDQLKQSLLQNCKAYEFSNWCRVVDYRFANEPLSAKGSILSDLGGRFNIGDIDQVKFPKFAGLYLAENPATALREKCGMDPQDDRDGLTGDELNLINNTAIIKVKGNITNILDLTEPKSLHAFYNQIKTIHLPLQFIARARKLKIDAMIPVRHETELLDTLLREQWRIMPMQFDIPANPQILGQLVHNAGIEGILYPSVKTQNKCLVIYPDNFRLTDSYIETEGESPESVTHKRIDKNTFNHFI